MNECWKCHAPYLSAQEILIYLCIRHSGGELSPKKLREYHKISATALSNVLKKLEIKNLIERQNSPRYRTYRTITDKAGMPT